MRPVSQADRHDAPGSVNELVPCVTAMVDDVPTVVEDTIGEPIFADELPDVLDRIELGALGGQWHERDVRWHEEFRGEMPSGLVDQDNGMCAGRDGSGNLSEVKVHRVGITFRQHQPGALAVLGAGRTENISRCRALVASSDRPRSAQGPTTGDFILLTDSGFVREPYFYLAPIDALRAGDLAQNGRPLFLNPSIAPVA
jgi:hypothetical protein